MNLGRFHSAIFSIKNEIEVDDNLILFSTLQTNLQNSIAQQTSEAATLFKKSYADLISILENAESNFTFPTRRKIYEEIGATEYIGIGLANKIKETISENQISPANALAEMQKINTNASKYFEQMKVLDATFTELDIEYDELRAGDFEIGFSFPKEIIGTDIESLENEFHKLDFALKTLQEISIGKVGEVNIKAISASEWQVFLDSLPALAACTTVAIERIAALYKTNLEIKLLKQQLDEKNLPEEVTKPLQEHIEKTVKVEIRKIAEDIVDEFYQAEDGSRKNELKNQASQALHYIADRMDHGATVEVHAEPPKEPKSGAEGEGANNDIDPKVLEEYERLKELSTRVNNLSRLTQELEQSVGPILSLKHDDYEEK